MFRQADVGCDFEQESESTETEFVPPDAATILNKQKAWLQELILLQAFDGSWKDTLELREVLALPNDAFLEGPKWATALVLAALELYLPGLSAEWDLLAKKSKSMAEPDRQRDVDSCVAPLAASCSRMAQDSSTCTCAQNGQR